jgi:hypothetical protein
MKSFWCSINKKCRFVPGRLLRICCNATTFHPEMCRFVPGRLTMWVWRGISTRLATNWRAAPTSLASTLVPRGCGTGCAYLAERTEDSVTLTPTLACSGNLLTRNALKRRLKPGNVFLLIVIRHLIVC